MERRNYYALEDLRQVIPNFDKRCENYVLAWNKQMDQRLVVRMGYWKMNFYGDKYDSLFVKKESNSAGETSGCPLLFMPDDFPFTDADHVFGLGNSVILFKDNFGEFIPHLYLYQPDWLDVMEQVFFHETSEPKIGDWTQDGSYNTEIKDRLEQEEFDKLMELYPKHWRPRHQAQYAKVRDEYGIGKLFDKQGFIQGIVYAKAKALENKREFAGSLLRKVGATEQDGKLCERTGSKRPIDNIYAGMLMSFKGKTELLPFFMGINEAAYRLFFNEYDPDVRGCVPGEVPPGVKQFY